MKQKTTYMRRNKRSGIVKLGDIDEIAEFLINIKNRSTENVLEQVKQNPQHVIYKYVFNNSNKKAIHGYRLERVRKVILSVSYNIETTGTNNPIPVFYNIINSHGQRKYKTQKEVFENLDYSNQVIKRAISELENWKERYKFYTQLSSIIKPIEKFVKSSKKER